MHDASFRAVTTPILVVAFTGVEITAVRRMVTQHAAEAGLVGDQLQDFVLAVNEIVTNAVVHGGGGGELRLWETGQYIGCDVTDSGPGGVLDTAGQAAPDGQPALETGRHGLRLARLLVDRVDVLESATGTAVRLTAGLRLTG